MGAMRLHPPRELRAPPWDLKFVLGSLIEVPYEPFGQIDFNCVFSEKSGGVACTVGGGRVHEVETTGLGCVPLAQPLFLVQGV